jgi:hypothetical protein
LALLALNIGTKNSFQGTRKLLDFPIKTHVLAALSTSDWAAVMLENDPLQGIITPVVRSVPNG